MKGKGIGASSPIQCMKRPCLQPAAMSQSVEARAMIIRMITIRPQMKAITYKQTKRSFYYDLHTIHIAYTVSVSAASPTNLRLSNGLPYGTLNVLEYTASNSKTRDE